MQNQNATAQSGAEQAREAAIATVDGLDWTPMATKDGQSVDAVRLTAENEEDLIVYAMVAGLRVGGSLGFASSGLAQNGLVVGGKPLRRGDYLVRGTVEGKTVYYCVSPEVLTDAVVGV